MITTANRVYVTTEYRAEFEERFRSRAKLVDGMPEVLLAIKSLGLLMKKTLI